MTSADSYREWLRARHRPAHARRSAKHNAAFFVPSLRSGMQVLDVGCGPGAITIGLASLVLPGALVGVDRDVEAIEAAQRLARSGGITNVRFVAASAYALPFNDRTFDGAFMHAPRPMPKTAEDRRPRRGPPRECVASGDACLWLLSLRDGSVSAVVARASDWVFTAAPWRRSRSVPRSRSAVR